MCVGGVGVGYVWSGCWVCVCVWGVGVIFSWQHISYDRALMFDALNNYN